MGSASWLVDWVQSWFRLADLPIFDPKPLPWSYIQDRRFHFQNVFLNPTPHPPYTGGPLIGSKLSSTFQKSGQEK